MHLVQNVSPQTDVFCRLSSTICVYAGRKSVCVFPPMVSCIRISHSCLCSLMSCQLIRSVYICAADAICIWRDILKLKSGSLLLKTRSVSPHNSVSTCCTLTSSAQNKNWTAMPGPTTERQHTPTHDCPSCPSRASYCITLHGRNKADGCSCFRLCLCPKSSPFLWTTNRDKLHHLHKY